MFARAVADGWGPAGRLNPMRKCSNLVGIHVQLKELKVGVFGGDWLNPRFVWSTGKYVYYWLSVWRGSTLALVSLVQCLMWEQV